jgi:hypothetical protein
MIKNAFQDRMPELPSYKAEYRVIRLEPVSYSGELLTIGIMAKSDTEYKVIQTIQPNTLKCMYGSQYANISNLIGIVIESASQHLSQGLEIASWLPPFDGAYADEAITARSNKQMEGILFQAINSYSSLYQGDITDKAIASLTDSDVDENDKASTHLIKQVKDLINPKYRGNFNRKVQLLRGTTLNIDYLGINYNANIANFNASNAGNALTRVKAKLLDFVVFRDEREKENINANQSYEMIIGCKADLDERTAHAIYEIEDMANSKGIVVAREHAPQSIAKRITTKEIAIAQ